jgi:hypothetical protein
MPRSRARPATAGLGRGQITRGGVTSARGIAKALNARGVATARGGTWTAVQVLSIIARVAPLR